MNQKLELETMWRISKGGKIISIKLGDWDVDSVLIIPGVTHFQSVTTKDHELHFAQTEWQNSIRIYFSSVGELERFLVSFLRDSKIDQILDKK
jgi:hypothetical protein